MGHANIDVIPNVYGKSWWEERVDVPTRAAEAASAGTENHVIGEPVFGIC